MGKLRQILKTGEEKLSKAGCESPAFDAMCLFEKAFGMDRQAVILYGDQPADERGTAVFIGDIARRASKTPLQYILGRWPFGDLELLVGEGVLIPREDTLVLCNTALEYIDGTCAVADLCAGTGAVGLTLSAHSGCRVDCFEGEKDAYSYLEKNIAQYPFPVRAVYMDIVKQTSEQRYDMMVANPPYIKTAALGGLADEVKKEPSIALDGGADGLLFYRSITKNWLPCLKKGKALAVEIGHDQGEEVSEIFAQAGLENVRTVCDLAGLDRVVVGVKNK